MARKNAEVERLAWEVKALRDQIKRMQADPGDLPVTGCGDSSCIVARSTGGMHTNGGCRCSEVTIRRAMMYWHRRSEFLQESIVELRQRLQAEGMMQGHETVCSMCGEKCNCLAADPGKWPVYLGNDLLFTHVECVRKKLKTEK